MQDQAIASVYKAVDQEKTRTSYPEDFPALPEIPVGRYSDPVFHGLEMKHLWPKSWLHAGHVSELPKPGAYKLFERLGLSIIVSHMPDGSIKAFHNICRHRASAILLEKKGSVRHFVCPYHSWAYAPDGRLIAVPGERNFACLDKAERGLLPVRCETMRGMIFLNLDSDASPLAEFLAPTERQIGDFAMEDMVVKNIISVDLDCNWKTAYDNFLEIYHVNTVHSKSLAPYLDSNTFSISLFANGHARFATRKRGETIFGTDVTTPDGGASMFRDLTVALPMFPNSFTALDPVGFAFQNWWPTGPNKSVMVLTLMGWKNDSEEDRIFWEGMGAQISAIAGEDMVLFGDMQRNMESGLIPGVLMGYQERAIYWYQEEIDRRIGVENIPEHLRVSQVLAGQVID